MKTLVKADLEVKSSITLSCSTIYSGSMEKTTEELTDKRYPQSTTCGTIYFHQLNKGFVLKLPSYRQQQILEESPRI